MVALRQLLDIPHLELRPRHLAALEAQVRWVATSELTDPSPFLEGGEVLLSTGLNTGGWQHEWDPYVRRLAAAGIVAIGLGIDLTHTSSPEPLIAACRHHDMNLFEVPQETTFVAISQAMVELLHEAEETLTRAAFDLQRQLTQAALREDAPAALVERVGDIGAMACVTGPDGVPELGPFGAARGTLFHAHLIADSVRRMRPKGLRAASSVTTADGTLLIHPLGIRGRPVHYLVTGFAGRVTDLQRSTVTTAVALLSLAEERERVRHEPDRRVRDRAIELLVCGDHRTAHLLLELGLPPRPRMPREPVVLRATGPPGEREDAIQVLESRSVPCGRLGGQLVVLSPAPGVRELADELASRRLRVGIGALTTPFDPPRSYETAGHALELTTDETPVVTWDLSVNQGVLSLVEPDRAAAFSTSFLTSLHASRHGDVLVDTLRSYLLHQGSQLKIAQDLGVHRNTVRQRIRRIEGILGRPLTNPQVQVDAWFALQVQEGRR